VGFPIPAICDSPLCRHGYLVLQTFEIEEGAAIALRDMVVGPCPRCGSSATIPDGIYRKVNFKGIHSSGSYAQVELLQRMVGFMRAQIAANKTSALIAEEAAKELPHLQGWFDHLPKKRPQAYTLLEIFVTVLLFIIGQIRASKESKQSGENTIAILAKIADSLPACLLGAPGAGLPSTQNP